MPKTTYYTAASIDGFIADQDDSLDWLFSSAKDSPNPFAEFFQGIGAFAMGATTYEWIRANDAPESWAGTYGDVPAWVFTHRELPSIPRANLHFVRDDVVPVHDAMIAAAGDKNIWLVGGGDLVGAFADAGRLDEIVLGIAPVALGGGAPLLPRRLDLELTSVERMGDFAYLIYSRE